MTRIMIGVAFYLCNFLPFLYVSIVIIIVFRLLAECHLDGGKRSEAAATSLSCLQIARMHAPSCLFNLLRFVVKHNLLDHQKFAKELKSNQSLALVYGLCRLK